MQKVVHVRREHYDVYIGRGSAWGNPYKIGRDGDRTEVLGKYKEYLLRGEGRPLLERIGELEEKTLGCFCAQAGGLSAREQTRCHGQLLLQILDYRGRALAQKAC